MAIALFLSACMADFIVISFGGCSDYRYIVWRSFGSRGLYSCYIEIVLQIADKLIEVIPLYSIIPLIVSFLSYNFAIPSISGKYNNPLFKGLPALLVSLSHTVETN